MRAPGVKLGQELIIKVTFDAGEYQGSIVQKAYCTVGDQALTADRSSGCSDR